MFLRRAVIGGVLMGLAIAVLVSRLVYLQVVQYNYFADLSQGNRIRIEPIPPNRGLILDRSGLPLAINTPSYQLELTREQVPDLDATLRELANLALLDREDVTQLKREIKVRHSFEAVPLKLQLSDEQLARFAVRRHDFPGVEIRPRLTRHYPLATSAAHAVGYVSAISEDDQKRLNMDEYAGTSLTGKAGVERRYEQELHGRTGYQQLVVNAQGRRVDKVGTGLPDLKRREAVAGNDVYLTIDERVQQTAEQALHGRRAAAVAIDPRNGDVLAFVSTPSFDPNLFVRGISGAQYRTLTEDLDKPLYDRALRGEYAPGSTIKPFMALTALQYGVMAPDDHRFCRGFFTLPGSSHRYRDWKPAGHGSIDMRGAIMQSCDTYFYAVAEMLGIDRIHDFLNGFGLGAVTGIDIDGERPGLLPSPEWKRKAFKRKELQTWFPGETVIIGIGQGYLLLTPLQLAHATATMAMRGQGFRPRLVHAVRDAVTGKVREFAPVKLPPVAVNDANAWEVIHEGMVDVTAGAHGTARAVAAGALYSIAAKTGSAQVAGYAQNVKYNASQFSERVRDNALFVAFAPADNPKIAVSVIVENGEHGATAAGPIARQIFDAYLLTPEQLAEQEAKKLLKQPQQKPQAQRAAPAAPPADSSDE